MLESGELWESSRFLRQQKELLANIFGIKLDLLCFFCIILYLERYLRLDVRKQHHQLDYFTQNVCDNAPRISDKALLWLRVGIASEVNR